MTDLQLYDLSSSYAQIRGPMPKTNFDLFQVLEKKGLGMNSVTVCSCYTLSSERDSNSFQGLSEQLTGDAGFGVRSHLALFVFKEAIRKHSLAIWLQSFWLLGL